MNPKSAPVEPVETKRVATPNGDLNQVAPQLRAKRPSDPFARGVLTEPDVGTDLKLAPVEPVETKRVATPNGDLNQVAPQPRAKRPSDPFARGVLTEPDVG